MSDFQQLRLSYTKGLQAKSGRWYKNVQFLGSGGNASTFLVLCTDKPYDGVLFALKIFTRLGQPKRRARFEKESAFLVGCDHPSIMRVFDTGNYVYTYDGIKHDYPFIVAEYLPKTLELVIREDSISMAERISYAMQLLSALMFLRSQDPAIIHRDIKPRNIFVKAKSAVLGDFGLLKAIDGLSEDDRDVISETLTPALPFGYPTPELITYSKGESEISTASDVFQLGLVLAELFTGFVPLAPRGDRLDPIVLRGLSKVPGKCGYGIACLIKKMLALNPADRPTPEEIIDSWQAVFWDATLMLKTVEGEAF